MATIYFDSKKLPKGKREYVAFIDIMGTKNKMYSSVHEASNAIFKLHAAILSAYRTKAYHNVFIYPVMDGAYITSSSKASMVNIIVRIYRSLSSYLSDYNNEHFFVIRSAIAYGTMFHGHDIPYGASKIFELDLPYKNNILLGKPMIDAYQSEALAAPFGVYLHDSAIKKNKYTGSFESEWKWYNDKKLKVDKKSTHTISVNLYKYFMAQSIDDNYPEDKRTKHIEMLKDYYGFIYKNEEL